MTVLGIETSCDETSAAVIDDTFKVLSNKIHTQSAHAAFGGIVPEIASREHCLKIEEVVSEALKQAGVKPEEIGLICAASSPGLIGALLVGLSFAKGFALARKIPFVAVNHMDAHIKANVFTDPRAVEPPYVALTVSGGHTFLVLCGLDGRYTMLGDTLDDAAGEALDKAGKLMGLSYPAGREIEAVSKAGNPSYYHFPRALPAKANLNFSFSGLKTALKNYLKSIPSEEAIAHKADILASYQEAVMDSLAAKSLHALRNTGCRKLLIAGGVACNGLLREKLSKALGTRGQLFFPAPSLCTDNGAMIAAAGLMKYGFQGQDSLEATASAEFDISGLTSPPRRGINPPPGR